MRFLDRHNHERINNEIMFRVLNATPLNSYRLGTRRKRKMNSVVSMKWQSSRETIAGREGEEEEWRRSTVPRRCKGVKFHATHTRDRLTASATRISPRRCQRAEIKKGGLGRATTAKSPGEIT